MHGLLPPWKRFLSFFGDPLAEPRLLKVSDEDAWLSLLRLPRFFCFSEDEELLLRILDARFSVFEFTEAPLFRRPLNTQELPFLLLPL